MVDVHGKVTAVSDGSSLRLEGHGQRLRVEINGALPAGRRHLAVAARRLDEAGLRLDVTDRRGRRLASAGRSVSSVLGRVFVGNRHVRPTVRGVIAFARHHVK